MAITIDADDATTKEIRRFAEKHGMTVSAFVKAASLEAIRHDHVPEEELEPTPWLIEQMKRADEDLKAGRASGPMSMDEAIAHLRTMIHEDGE